MLVLTRRQGESIVVGQNIVITVVEIKGGQVRIGINAPRDVQIHRQEIFEQVRAENMAAVASARVARDALANRRKNET
jgi:carbon storage regulator